MVDMPKSMDQPQAAVSPEAPAEMEAARNQAAAEVEAEDPELAKAIRRAELSTWQRIVNAAKKAIEIEK